MKQALQKDFDPLNPKQQAEQARLLHFIGIGGTGMCGLAEVMKNLGWEVSGSDIHPSEATMRLQSIGVQVHIGHCSTHLGKAAMVVVSAAIPDNNPELEEARKRKLVIVSRGEMLSSLMRYKRGIAVAGSHGKTTTTSMLASLLAAGGLEPTCILGGRLHSVAANSQLGVGAHLVAEADESDDTFLRMQPEIAVLTNIDAEHLPLFNEDMAKLQACFAEFLNQVPVFGLSVICLDDPRAAELASNQGHRVLTYGLSERADFRASDIRPDECGFRFRLHMPDGTAQELRLGMPGRHNISNLLAAVAVAVNEQVEPDAIFAGIEDYQGVSRRLEVVHSAPRSSGEVLMISDYGHHPTEIRACLRALEENWSDYRPVLIFQPHRYSRTQSLFGTFVKLLAEVEELILLPTYPAGEDPLPGCDSLTLARAIAEQCGREPFCPAGFDELRRHLASRLRGGDLVLFQGAGDIGAFAQSYSTERSQVQ